MRSLLNLAGGGNGEESWAVNDLPGGILTIVDVDSPEGEECWQALIQRGETPIALTRRKEFEAHHLLHKPIRAREFLDLLDELKVSDPAPEALDTDERSDVPATPAMPLWQSWESHQDPQRATLAEHLRRRTWKTPIILMQETWPRLIIDCGSGSWFYDGSITDLTPRMFADYIPAQAGVPVSNADLVNETNGMVQRSLSELKWFAGLAQSRGRMHPDLVDEVEFMLTQVPPLAMENERFQHLARILIRAPITLDGLHQQSGEDVETLACFLNACYTCGRLLLNQSARAVNC